MINVSVHILLTSRLPIRMYDPDDFPDYAKNAEDETINYKTAVRGVLKNTFWAFYLCLHFNDVPI